jgi:hypothetical protein|eukprot:COSAG06_NODE_1140_length_10558_cov_34.662492_3_plen_100_part_00
MPVGPLGSAGPDASPSPPPDDVPLKSATESTEQSAGQQRAAERRDGWWPDGGWRGMRARQGTVARAASVRHSRLIVVPFFWPPFFFFGMVGGAVSRVLR